jgi:hypothetical protein
MIIGLSGYAQSGKNTVADILVEHHGFTQLAFADVIKELLTYIDPIIYIRPDGSNMTVSEFVYIWGWEEAKKENEVRRLLQALGLAGRNLIDEYLWISMTLSQIKDPHEGRYVISDVRFPNEAAALTSQGGQIWRIERPGLTAVNEHISETAMDPWVFDETIINDGSIEDLKKKIKVDL